ncbi:type VI secretion system tube protein Hcp [Rugamonas sp.]|uniref:Hcp family type VI secretion system effector n=1 Tax=Rugamonas sp. TaxID=1926287 RepID=UPI0025D374F7|nr:type VI secretion system tube protein Hcp [Rugamonas sp.]
MAIDVYLRIDGIQGESADDAHSGWIECTSLHFGVSQPKSATASTGGGHTAERANLTDILFTKLADLSTPLLLQSCASGKTIPKATFEFMRADANGTRIKYFDIELENVLIGLVSPGVKPGTILAENVSLKFSKIRWKYSQQKISGGSGGNTAGGWDLATNRTA